jgi:predicted metal-dependent phosphoesterase TrpH
LKSSRPVLKVDLHIHTSDDPRDRIPHSTRDVIDHAQRLGYGAIAITLHDRQLDLDPFANYAADRGVVLIPGIERTIDGCHVLLLNFPGDVAAQVESFDDVAPLKRRYDGLVVAPHPFFPGPNSLFGRLDRHAELFDAVEYNAMFTASLNFNRRAEEWARAHGKPLVGNGDVHRLVQLGTTYSLVDAAPDAASICAAVAAGRVRVEASPLPWSTALRTVADIVVPFLGIKPPSIAPVRTGDSLAA